MVIGFLSAVLACFIWGTIFIIPGFLTDFSPVEVALGRYFCYGLFSFLLMIGNGTHYFKRFSSQVWKKALLFGLICNVLYYIGTVVGLRYATAPLTILIIGLCPIVTALYGNWRVKEFPLRKLLFPCACIAVGILLVNLVEVDWHFSSSSPLEYFIGVLGAITALLTWAWFAVENAKFLKAHREIKKIEWSTLIGVGTLVWVVILAPLFALGENQMVDLKKFFHLSADNLRFLAGTAFLGIICAWIGGLLWGHASTVLPITLMGPLIIFESIFGITFVFIYEQKLPSLLEMLGIASMLAGIFLSLQTIRKKTAETT